jgi:ribosomal-protein-serine acetyltransferase
MFISDYGFSKLNLESVGIRCATGNLKSFNVPKRLGFTFSERVQDAEWLYDHYFDHHVYVISKSQCTQQEDG